MCAALDNNPSGEPSDLLPVQLEQSAFKEVRGAGEAGDECVDESQSTYEMKNEQADVIQNSEVSCAEAPKMSQVLAEPALCSADVDSPRAEDVKSDKELITEGETNKPSGDELCTDSLALEKEEQPEEKERSGPDEEGEEAELVENASDDSTNEYETMEEIEEARAASVVTSTHDISRDSGVKYLTESERQLGRVKPIWIADKETLSCMLCCTKFTVFLRRHHCRCCGRVLCAQCTTRKVSCA
ncbi:unnamed protein product [Gongylonema pulchrum]|uniref:FYVE-type domain-containing protein n=1 Tax=Gongylonema pulchrum TaxID=637853 RepID=A0A183E313_9BILA|nr:unnamed protein product [Gongylonema pulchrum]